LPDSTYLFHNIERCNIRVISDYLWSRLNIIKIWVKEIGLKSYLSNE
jgi:ribosome-interacting GTPase 1